MVYIVIKKGTGGITQDVSAQYIHKYLEGRSEWEKDRTPRETESQSWLQTVVMRAHYSVGYKTADTCKIKC